MEGDVTSNVQTSLQAPPQESNFAGEYDDSINLGSYAGLRQGDVLQLIPGESTSELGRHFGVVVTANCDLALNKHFGVITYVPLVPVEHYVHQFLLPKVLTVEENKTVGALKKLVLEKYDDILHERIADMICANDYTVDEICNSLPGEIQIRNEIIRRIAVAKAIENSKEAVDPSAAFRSLTDYATVLDSTFKSKKSNVNGFLSDLHQRLTKNMSGDCLFLNQISPNHRTGYAAILRLLRELPHDRIALSARSEQQRANGWFVARHISRLGTLYTHRLVQQMSHVFTDIGLPTDYEAARDAVVSSRLQELLGNPPMAK
jgi:hypothetical protein